MINKKIIDTFDKSGFNGKKFGFLLENGQKYIPFFQNIVSNEAIGKTLIVKYEKGQKIEEVK